MLLYLTPWITAILVLFYFLQYNMNIFASRSLTVHMLFPSPVIFPLLHPGIPINLAGLSLSMTSAEKFPLIPQSRSEPYSFSQHDLCLILKSAIIVLIKQLVVHLLIEFFGMNPFLNRRYVIRSRGYVYLTNTVSLAYT